MLFSVIVANFNNERYLPDMVRSIQAQTYPDWELVIVDDFSSSDPHPWLDPFLSDKRIKYARHKQNMGAAAAFRTAFDLSTGELIGMLGADDALTTNALERMAKAHVDHPEASMANSTCFKCDESLEVLHVYRHYRPLKPGEALIRDICIGSFATFKRKAYLETQGFDPAFKKALDHDIYLKLDEVGELVYVDEPLYLYRTNPNGISQFENGFKAAQYSLLARYNAYLRRKGTNKANLTPAEARMIRKTWYLREMHRSRIDGDRMQVFRLAQRALVELPEMMAERSFWGNLARSIVN